MTNFEVFLSILIAVLGTVFTRSIAFFIFKDASKIPKFVKYLSTVLPCAVMALLVVFSYKGLEISKPDIIFYQVVGSAVVILLQVLRRNMLLSIMSGTGTYVLLLHLFG